MARRMTEMVFLWLLLTSPEVKTYDVSPINGVTTYRIPPVQEQFTVSPSEYVNAYGLPTSALRENLSTEAPVRESVTAVVTQVTERILESTSDIVKTRSLSTDHQEPLIISESATGSSVTSGPENTSENTTDTVETPSPGIKAGSLPAFMRGEGVLDEDDFVKAFEALNTATTPVMLVGILTNMVAISVFLRMPTSVTSTFFCVASCLDIAFLLTGLPAVFVPAVTGKTAAFQNEFYLTYVTYISRYVTNTTRKVIVCVTMMMSLDRYLVVAFPFRIRRVEHLRCPRLYSLLVALLAYLLDINILFKFKVVTVHVRGDNTSSRTVLSLTRTQMYDERRQLFTDISLASSFIFQYIPLLLLVVFNILLVATLVKHSRRMRAKFDYDDGKERNTQKTRDEFEACREDDSQGGHQSKDKTKGQGQETKSRGHCNFQGQEDTGQGQGHDMKHPPSKTTKYPTSKLERQNSTTVLVYSFLFVLLALPNTLFPLLRKTIPGFAHYEREHYLVLTLDQSYSLLDSVSSAMNFAIYFATGSAFRAGVFRLFGRRSVATKTGASSSVGSFNFSNP